MLYVNMLKPRLTKERNKEASVTPYGHMKTSIQEVFMQKVNISCRKRHCEQYEITKTLQVDSQVVKSYEVKEGLGEREMQIYEDSSGNFLEVVGDEKSTILIRQSQE